jgi:hypothetical protein
MPRRFSHVRNFAHCTKRRELVHFLKTRDSSHFDRGFLMLDRLSRFAPFTGILFVVLMLVGILTSHSSPNANASGQRVIAFYTAHRAGQETSDIVLAFALVAFLLFIACLWGFLRQAPSARTLSLLGFGGAVAFAVGFGLFGGIDYSLAYASHSLTPDAAKALNVLDNELFLPNSIGLFVFAIGTGLAIARSGLLPAWLGWFVLVFGIATGTPAFFPGVIGVMVWALIVSVLIYRRNEQPASVGAVPEPARA